MYNIYTHKHLHLVTFSHVFLSCSPGGLLRRCDKKPERRKKEERLPPFAPVARFGLVQSLFLCMCVSYIFHLQEIYTLAKAHHHLVCFLAGKERREIHQLQVTTAVFFVCFFVVVFLLANVRGRNTSACNSRGILGDLVQRHMTPHSRLHLLISATLESKWHERQTRRRRLKVFGNKQSVLGFAEWE